MTAIEQPRREKPQPYVIRAEPRPERYARGWYVIGNAASVSTSPRKVEAFGRRLVAYRGRDDCPGPHPGPLSEPPSG